VTGGIAIAAIPVASELVLHNGARHAADINVVLRAGSIIEIVSVPTGCAGRQPGAPRE